MPSGYYRYPTIHQDTVVFVCEDDLWTVPAEGGIARRLTSNLGEVTRPRLSPDGKLLAFVGREEGQAEVYLMPALGGAARRMTFMGGWACITTGWTPDGKIVFANNAAQPFGSLLYQYTIEPDGGPPQRLNIGPAHSLAFGLGGRMVIGRNTGDPARWKRYRGGTAGQLWIDPDGDGNFRPLLQLKGNLASPMWLQSAEAGDHIYFLSDHEGFGNLYSCLPTGENLQRHTDHADFYARNASSDGQRIVYHAGADLYVYTPSTGQTRLVPVELHSPQVQRSRKFVSPVRYLESAELHPKGQFLAATARGKLFTFANWEGAVLQHGEPDGVRYRLPAWLNDGERLIAVTDQAGTNHQTDTGQQNGEERFVLLDAGGDKPPEFLDGLDTGRPVDVAVNPKKDVIAFSNHRHELMVLDLASRELKTIDRGQADRIAGFDWSPDGEWLAYSVSISLQVMVLKLWKAATGEIFPLTAPVLRDVAPAFDPAGKYLYFLSYRHFDPVYDNLHFDLNFPRGIKPYLITLQKDLPSPFVLQPRKESKPEKEAEEKKAETQEEGQNEKEEKKEEEKKEEKPIQIDVEGIAQRLIAFPVEEGRYGRILGLKDGKVIYSLYPVEGTLSQDFFGSKEPPAKGALYIYSFEDQKEEMLVPGITDFAVSRDASTLLYRAGNRLRTLKAGEKPDRESNGFNRKSGWIDVERMKVSVIPGLEWRQMFREAWRLQRDQFWTPDMSQIDWIKVYNQYISLVERVSTRAEFSDLTWEMQGELGTSHCYEFGGDYRSEPNYHAGYLGADFTFEPGQNGWRISHIVHGDSWDEAADSPLNRPGINLQEGDILLAVNGRRLSREVSPGAALVNLAGSEVTLNLLSSSSGEAGQAPAPRTVTIRTMSNETKARYREWVETNRRRVHEATGGRVGYIHIPDMGANGYAEFHRGYLAEVDRQGLIVDLRFNGGGNVSSLLLEKLARRRLGYDKSRWGLPVPYPPESVMGAMVALTNEQAGSDGDIFSHGFKLMKLGPLLGKRTWGGVIGIWPRHFLVDGTITTQPEFSFYFNDVGWGVENYGTDPDIEVDNTPQDYARGYDAQLERTIEEVQKLLDANPPKLPDFSNRPSLAPPTLPAKPV